MSWLNRLSTLKLNCSLLVAGEPELVLNKVRLREHRRAAVAAAAKVLDRQCCWPGKMPISRETGRPLATYWFAPTLVPKGNW